MNNIHDVRTELVGIYAGLKGGTLELKLASEMNNTLGKILSSLKVELAKCALADEKPNIPFLNSTRQLPGK